MVKKRQTKRQRDIKTKLMAAICMLLVSSIMMVSTTYAWFTLSTAPEVTGINTAVGANGSLEMALLPLDGDSSKISAGTGDSMMVKTKKAANITWGNLVDVGGTGDDSYGLDLITLYPSALNSSAEGDATKLNSVNPLSTPKYGADGRISEMSANTVTGVYTNGAFYESAPNGQTIEDDPHGVRAVGTISGMSPRNLAWRQALAEANTLTSRARSIAADALNSNGSTLADVAITHALNKGTDKDVYTGTDVAAMKNVVNALLGTTDNPGALTNIEKALKYYIVARSIAESSAEDTYEDIQTNIMKATLTDLADGKVTGAILPAGYTGTDGYIAKLNAALSNVTTAQTELNTLTGDGPFEWADVEPGLTPLVSIAGMKLNGIPVSDVMDDPGSAAGSIMADGLNLTLATGSGVFADIADFSGDYSAGITIPELVYGTMAVPNVKATMNTNGAKPPYLEQVATVVNTYGFKSATGGNGANPLSDFYGYIIDLAFRTNAADSFLQIQPEAVDRIYADGTNVNTMGHGATMSFKSDSSTFYPAAVADLMSAIRIVFFDPGTYNIIGYARLDAANKTTGTDGTVTMALQMCDKDGNPLTDNATTPMDETVGIMALNQNEIHELSVLVYLDGNLVDNADVAADAAKSMTGSLNLQFSSSAQLKAMEYADLMAGEAGALDGAANTPTTPAAPTVSDVTTGTVTGATSATIKHITSGSDKALVATIDGVGEDFQGTVTIGGQTATWQTVGTMSGWAVIGAEVPTGAVDIIVTAPTTGG